MKVQRYCSAGLAVLSSVLALISRNVIARRSTSSGTRTWGCYPAYASDGDCDDENNTQDCGYDGGDCCECTCDDTAQWTCGGRGFSCLDPSATCVDDDDVTTLPTAEDFSDSPTTTARGCSTGSISNGECDLHNNDEECGYDGGDCCECTCVDTSRHICGEQGFWCLDPDAPCVDDDDVTTLPTAEDYSDSPTTTAQGCSSSYSSDGDCDLQNNTKQCGYDGGDCCECTCVDTAQWICGDSGFTCLDPSAACFDDNDVIILPTNDDYSDSQTTTHRGCSTGFMSDGDCDLANNTDECGYDGGDCCECTCVDTAQWICGGHGFLCLDPDAPCVNDDDVTTLPATDDYSSYTTTTTTPACNLEFASDGDCDLANNTEECGYDGGDCCECTCVSNSVYTCGDPSRGVFQCIDQSAPCFNGGYSIVWGDNDDDGNLSASYSYDTELVLP